jgi:hypothetical protein
MRSVIAGDAFIRRWATMQYDDARTGVGTAQESKQSQLAQD